MVQLIYFTLNSFLLSSFISSFSLRALKTRCLSDISEFFRGEPGPSQRDNFTHGDKMDEDGLTASWGPGQDFLGVRKGSC